MIMLKGWQNHHYPAGGCQRLLEGWFVVIFVFSLYRQRRAGRGRSPEVTQDDPVEHAFSKMYNDCLRNMVKTLVWYASHWVWTGHPDRRGVYRMPIPWSSGWRVGRATCPKEECFVRPPHVRLGVVPTIKREENNQYGKNINYFDVFITSLWYFLKPICRLMGFSFHLQKIK